MTRFDDFLWTGGPEGNIEHIARHQVEPHEVEEVCRNQDPLSLVQKGSGSRRKEPRRLYYVLGQTELGRYLFIVLRAAQTGTAYVITAREMTDTERRLYERRRSHG